MPEATDLTIELTVMATTAGGPNFSETTPFTVDAYDKVQVTIPKGASGQVVEVQPGAAGRVQFLFIKSTAYSGPKTLAYSINDPEPDAAKRIVLDKAQAFIGAGAIGALGKPPQRLVFYNGLDTPATVTVLVGRKATTPPAP